MRFRRVSRTCVLLLGFFWIAHPSVAQDVADDASDKQKERVGKETLEHVKKFVVTDKNEQRYDPVETPLLSSTDPARGEWGSLWAFGKQGRPVVILELYKNTGREERWVQVLTLTSDKLVQCRLPTGPSWAPQQTQVELQPVTGAAPPAERTPRRERQAKLLARRFDAHEFWDPKNSRFELRLLETPLHTYRDEKTGLLDGILFGFVHGTNVEVLLFLEARAEGQQPPQWMYGLARVGSAEMHVNLDGKEIWQLARTPGVVGRSSDSYWITITLTGSK
ncbi:MAG: hypothetical protein WD894_01360 [Pirellulales bacterium]